jgi:OOP family OmpA-OmpF porin
MKKYFRVAIIGTFFLSTATFAQNGYLGFGVGSASYSEGPIDDSGTGFNIYGGYKANENFGFELQYTDFGKQEGTYTYYNNTFDTTAEISGLGLSAVGFLPFSDSFDLFLKLGVFAWDIDGSIENASFGSHSGSDDGSDLLFGLGAEYQLSEQFSIRGAWEMVDNEDGDLDMLSINAQLNF